MKYLKTHEELELKNPIDSLIYKPGDYVLLDLEEMIKYNNSIGIQDPIPDTNFAEIVSLQKFDSSFPYPYVANICDTDTISVRQAEIKRLMNKEEIDDFNIMKNASKFNI